MGQPAKFDHVAFRYRNDDDSEVAASWVYAENTDGELDVDTNYRMRFEVENYGGEAGNVSGQLQYNLNAAGWNDVTEISAVVVSVDSAEYNDEDATTNQLTQGAGTFVAGKMDDADGAGGVTTAVSVSADGDDQHTEFEFCFQIVSGDVNDGDTVEMQLTHAGGVAYDRWTATPSITVNKEDESSQSSESSITADESSQSSLSSSSTEASETSSPSSPSSFSSLSSSSTEVSETSSQSSQSSQSSPSSSSTAVSETSSPSSETSLSSLSSSSFSSADRIENPRGSAIISVGPSRKIVAKPV